MNKEPLIPEEVGKLFPLGDARLNAIHWIENGIALDLNIPGVGPSRLRFDWPTEVRIHLDFDALAGGLLWEGTLEPMADGQLRLELDFGGAPEGSISLKCGSVSLDKGPMMNA